MEITKEGIFLGVDPGTTHLGFAVLDTCYSTQHCELFQIELERSSDPVTRMVGTGKLLSRCVNWYCSPSYACIEGASFGDRFRQVELAEVRTAVAIWAIDKEFITKIIPPLTVRANVFGNGRTKAQDVWTNIPSDAANALACAYFAMSFIAGE